MIEPTRSDPISNHLAISMSTREMEIQQPNSSSLMRYSQFGIQSNRIMSHIRDRRLPRRGLPGYSIANGQSRQRFQEDMESRIGMQNRTTPPEINPRRNRFMTIMKRFIRRIGRLCCDTAISSSRPATDELFEDSILPAGLEV